jgi:lipoate-protein ligase A
MRQWQLIIERTPQNGACNMAIDETLLESVSNKARRPTLRLYRWDPFCLSLGYGQTSADVDWERLNARGWQVVRRPTGGKAILHGDELTYSLTLPLDDDVAQGDIVESYRRISQGLIEALSLLGLAPQSERARPRGERTGPVCFEVPSHYEITVGGRKLIGSAQVRRRAGLLQHGTLPLMGDITRICEALPYASDAAREAAREQVRARATTLEAALGWRVSYDEAARAFVAGFERAFEVTFEESALTHEERALAEARAASYRDPSWTNKR